MSPMAEPIDGVLALNEGVGTPSPFRADDGRAGHEGDVVAVSP